MKLEKLSISECRGVRDLELEPDGDNLVIWGYNGTGKSAIVDAVEFLLTGEIQRLKGSGTKGITLKSHGPHVDANPEDAEVEATIALPSGESITISRSMDDPGSLEYQEQHETEVNQLLASVSDKHFLLTRKDILTFIQASDSKRANEMEPLLNLEDVEATRSSLVSAHNKAKNNTASKQSTLKRDKKRVLQELGLSDWSENQILTEINDCREALGGEHIEELDADHVQSEIEPPHKPEEDESEDDPEAGDGPNPEEAARTLLQQISDGTDLEEDAENLETKLKEVKDDPQLQDLADRKRLYKIGTKLVGDTDECPLCGKTWDPDELETHVSDCLSDIKSKDNVLDEIDTLSESLRDPVTTTLAALKDFEEATEEEEIPFETAEIRGLLEDANAFLQDPATQHASFSQDISDIPGIVRLGELRSDVEGLAPDEEDSEADDAETEEEDESEMDPGTAWDSLTRIQDKLASVEEARAAKRAAAILEARAAELKDTFIDATKTELDELYEDLSDRFSELYRSLHAPDEENFEADLAHEGPGVEMNVDFYERGGFEPNALHSEGHQDSMGLCLFLALREQLPGTPASLILLDDVVMSIDAGHRKELANLLTTEFPDEQFFITTHDKNWARQLKTEGVVSRSGKVDIYNWDLETGPTVNTVGDFMEKVHEEMEADVNAAAARLRRGAEAFFSDACHRLNVRVPYRREARWTLWELLPPAASKFSDLLKAGKRWAQDNGHDEKHGELCDLDDRRGEAMKALQAEKWPVNPATHFTPWEDIGPSEFEVVVEAFEALFDIFTCSKCEAHLGAMLDGSSIGGVACPEKCTYWLIPEE